MGGGGGGGGLSQFFSFLYASKMCSDVLNTLKHVQAIFTQKKFILKKKTTPSFQNILVFLKKINR